MREKIFSARLVCLMLVLCICLSFAACKKDDPSTNSNDGERENKIFTMSAQNNEFAGYGNYVFYSWDTVYRYNSKTETLVKACRDIECDKNCPFDGTISTIMGVYDGKLYFYAIQASTERVFIAYQDILSGEVTLLKAMERMEDSGTVYAYVERECVYYERMILKDGGDKTKPEDYERYICRVSIDEKKDEVFLKCSENEGLGMACGGKLIISSEGDLYSIDIETKEKRLLFDCETNDTLNTVGRIRYVDGKIYVQAKSKYTYTPELTGGEVQYTVLFSVDINSGEVKKVLNEPISYFCVTDDAIYYVPFKFRILYMPEDYENNKEDLKIWRQDYTVYACDLDGKNIRAVYSNDKISYGGSVTVLDGVLYSLTGEYLEDEHTYSSKVLFTAIDIESGKMVRLKRPE